MELNEFDCLMWKSKWGIINKYDSFSPAQGRKCSACPGFLDPATKPPLQQKSSHPCRKKIKTLKINRHRERAGEKIEAKTPFWSQYPDPIFNLVFKISKLSFFGPYIFKLLIILDHAVIPPMENPTWLMDYTASLKIMLSVSELMAGTKLTASFKIYGSKWKVWKLEDQNGFFAKK